MADSWKEELFASVSLELGFGLLFSLDEASVMNHLGEWKVHAAELAGAQAEELGPSVKPGAATGTDAATRADREPIQSCAGATEELQAVSSAQQEPAAEEPAAEEPEKPEAEAAEAEDSAADEAVQRQRTVQQTRQLQAEDSAADEADKSKYGDAVNAGVDPSQRHQVLEQIVKSEVLCVCVQPVCVLSCGA